MNVWVVSIEWNDPPAEVTGDSGIVGVYWTREDAERAAVAQCKEFDEQGQHVYNYTMVDGRYCIACGEIEEGHSCGNIDPDSAEEFCDECGAELTELNTCLNDHDDWDIDVHVREITVEGTPPSESVGARRTEEQPCA